MAFDIGPGQQGKGVRLAARETDGRNITLELSEDLATGLMRLLEQALVEADWGFPEPNAAPAEPASASPPIVLN